MSNGNSINVFDDIQSLCKAYRLQLKKGDRKRIEDFLDSIGGASREMLFQNLLLIDVEFRRRQKQDLSSDDYISRFPQYGRLIRQAFFESTMMSQELLGDTPADEPTLVLSMPAARRLGEYELQRELGRGGFGVVYEARHLQRNDLMALKTLPTELNGQSHAAGDAERLHKFRREFRSLSEINHPNLVGMQTLEVDGDQWFFTMDLVSGVDFLDYVRPNGQLDEERLRATLKQMVHGIAALHEKGIVHRDLKPSNVVIRADGHVVILDFGLVAELQHRTDQTMSLQTRQFAGTPRYAAPEQAEGIRTTATDWYAFGVMLYETLTDAAPFEGSAVQLMVKKQTVDAPKLAGKDGLPQDLAELVDRLLQREPERRPDVRSIAGALGIAVYLPSDDSTDSSDETASNQPELLLIGRESQLAELENARQDLMDSREPAVVFICGRSGEGKTALAEKFLSAPRRDSEMLVLSGRCYDRESVPFKAIDSLIDALVAFLRSRTNHELQRLLPDDVHMLAHLFPVLRRVEAIAQRSATIVAGIESRQIRYRAFAALREMLVSISQSVPVILFIDDLQWGDADSADALFELLLPLNPPAVMLLGTYRSDEAHESPFLKAWRKRDPETDGRATEVTVEVSPLTEEQCTALLAARFGQESDAVREQAKDVFQGTRGNPYFLEQLIEGFNPETGTLQEISLTKIIDGRLAKLPHDAYELLTVVAVSGQALEVEEASQVAGQAGLALATLTHMRSEKLVRLIGSDDRQLVDTYHDKIRETVLQGIGRAERRRLHLKFAEYIEQASVVTLRDNAAIADDRAANPRVYDLAYHFSEAEDPRAFHYQLQAGNAALGEFAMETALENLSKAEQLQPPDLDRSTQFQLQFSLAEAVRGTERFDESRPVYKGALQLADSKLDVARCQYGNACGWLSQGELVAAKQHFDIALVSLGEPVPQTKVGQIAGTLINLVKFHLVPIWLIKRGHRKTGDQDSDFLISTIYNLYVYVALTDVLAWVQSFTRMSAIGKFSDDLGAKAITYSSYGGLLASHGFGSIGSRYARKSQDFVDKCTSEISKAVVAHDIGAFCYMAGKLDQAEFHLQASIPELERVQHHNLILSFHWLRHVHSIRGNVDRIIYWASQELQYAEKINDNVSIGYALYGLADGLSRRGDIEEAIAHAQEALTRLLKSRVLTAAVAGQELGRAQLQASDYEAAAQTLQRNVKFLLSNWFFTEFSLDTFPLQTESILSSNWPGGPDATTKARRREAQRSARWARFFCLRFPTLRPHCYRVNGRAATAIGKTKKALKYFDKAIASADKIDARYELARALIDKSVLDHSNAKTDRQRGLQMLEELGCVLPEAERQYLKLP